MPTYGVMRTTYKKSGKVVPRYTFDGQIMPTDLVPWDVQKTLEAQDTCEDTAKRCVVCLGPNATHTRFADMQVVDLCEDCYYNKRMGEVVQALRRLKEYQNARSNRQAKKQKDDEEIQEKHEENGSQGVDGILVSAKDEADLVKTQKG